MERAVLDLVRVRGRARVRVSVWVEVGVRVRDGFRIGVRVRDRVRARARARVRARAPRRSSTSWMSHGWLQQWRSIIEMLLKVEATPPAPGDTGRYREM